MSDMFRVSYSKKDETYTLIQEGITLTEEQARQISTAYLADKESNYDVSRYSEVVEWNPN